MFRATRLGLIIRVVGDSTDAARAMGLRPNRVRILSTAAGGALAGIGGAYLSLFYPGSWNEGVSSGQGLMAVALVIFARWNPLACFWAALLFGGAGAWVRHCNRSVSARATICSTQRPTCSRWGS